VDNHYIKLIWQYCSYTIYFVLSKQYFLLFSHLLCDFPFLVDIVVIETLICWCVKGAAAVPASSAATPTSAGNGFIFFVMFLLIFLKILALIY